MNDYCELLPFTGYEELGHGTLCTILEEKQLDHFFVKRPVKPKFITFYFTSQKKYQANVWLFYISNLTKVYLEK